MKKIDLYCERCSRSLKVAHLITGNDEMPVLANTFMKCNHCTRVIILKNFKEGALIKKADSKGKCEV